ncbi:DNA-protecting protein DprA [Candidatus Uhrbacteria bacterium]|nr:DNA-protecting protein DprA [Candidatus Uhrbacteria bacterium]
MDTIKTIHIDDPEYPALLRQSACPPKTLYCRGSIPLPLGRILGVVGTRKMSVIGRRSCEAIIPSLARAGYTIVSGLAYGVDALAHQQTVDNKGIAVGVLANGLDDESIYPRENRPLVHRIIESGGCVLSEFPAGTRPRREFFPQRNRIVAGMSHGILVIEAPEKSGTLITAFRALHENREVLAVPGPITHPTFAGANRLLQLGAHVITSAEDVFNVFGDSLLSKDGERVDPDSLSEQERVIFECIAREVFHLDEIADQTKLDIRTVHSTLGTMELKGLIQSMGNGRFIKK